MCMVSLLAEKAADVLLLVATCHAVLADENGERKFSMTLPDMSGFLFGLFTDIVGKQVNMMP